jgi:hypothetical protein
MNNPLKRGVLGIPSVQSPHQPGTGLLTHQGVYGIACEGACENIVAFNLVTHGLSLLLPYGEKGGMRGLRRCDTEIS